MRRSTISSTAALLGAQSRTRGLGGITDCCPGMEIEVAPGLAFPVRKAPTIPRIVFVLPIISNVIRRSTGSGGSLD
jgi:hypothetical protein